METIWEFKINGVTIDEPIGWDAMELTLQRDPQFHGLENVLSDNIKFWGPGADMITAEYEANGIDGELSFLIRYSCDGGLTFTQLFNGILNCFYYDVMNSEVSIKIEPSGFHRTVKNRLETPINLNSNVSIDGLPMSTINPFDLGLHSKAIVQKSLMKQNSTLLTVDSTANFNSGDNVAIGVYFPVEILTEELETPVEITDFFHYNELSAGTFGVFTLSGLSGNVTLDYKLKGTFQESIAAIRSYGLEIVLAYGTDGSMNEMVLFGPEFRSQTGGTTEVSFDISGSQIIPLLAGDHAYLNIRISNYNTTTTGTVTGFFNLISDSANFINFTQNSLANPSATKALLVHEVFAKIAESITGIQDSFRSDFFGRTNSEPYQYPSNGCGAWTAITNGLNIRSLLDKNNNLFPIITTFNDLFNSCDAVWNLGMKIEVDGAGKEFIRVEPKEYFYNASSIQTILQVSDLRRYPAQDLIFNTYKVGYEKWNLNITGSNAIDEYNSDRTYRIPVKKANKELKTMSKYIASGYLIEQTRRVQYQTAPTNDFETDNDLFFICTNRETITSSLYTTPASPVIYDAGTISERDENFEANSIFNVLNSSTVYNLRISPIRMAINWYKYTSASIFKDPTASIKFVSGTGNYQELDTMINDCIVVESVSQDQDLIASNIPGISAIPIYEPEYLQFTYPLSESEFLTIMANSENAIQVSCGAAAQYTGFIKSMKYGPTSTGGISSFILLRGECVLGDFNSDFSDDFNIGNC